MNPIKRIDATGLACPLPVTETKKALTEYETVETLVDNEIAVQNLRKLAKQLKYHCEDCKEADQVFRVVISRDEKTAEFMETESESLADVSVNSTEYGIVIDSDVMGRGSDRLGRVLIKAFLSSLAEQEHYPQWIICYNSGIFLTLEDSDVLEDLQGFSDKGVRIYACGACTNFYEKTKQVAVGEITNMYHIVTMMNSIAKIIKP